MNLAKEQLSLFENQSTSFELVGTLVNNTIEDLQDKNINAAFMHLNLAREQLGVSKNNTTAVQNMTSGTENISPEQLATQTQPSVSEGRNLDRGSELENIIPPSGSEGTTPPTEGESGYDLTVRVTDHPFGTSQVEIDITTENGYTDRTKVNTGVSGTPSHTFSIPSNQGQTVRVCVDAGLLYFEKCGTFATYERDAVASLSAK